MNRHTATTAIAWIATIPFAAWAAIRLLGLDSGYPLEALMSATPYVAALSVAAAAFALALRRRAPAALAALAAICLAVVVLPRTFGDGTVDAAGRQTVKVLAANAHFGRADPAGILDLVDELHPDILTIEEYTPGLRHELAARGIDSRLPYAVGTEGRRHKKEAVIYSRFPLRELASGPIEARMAHAEARLPGGHRLKIVAVHPYPPIHPTVTREWEEVLSSLPSTGRGTPWLLAGDFNATFDQTPFRDLVDRGYQDAGEVAGKGLDATFPSHGLLTPPITIDHILADERWGIVDYSVEPLPNSDHRAIYAELALPKR